MENLITQKDRNKSGVYKITNKINGKIYIGCSKNMSNRFRSHLYSLSKNKSNCIILQNAVMKYGLVNFIFEILEVCSNYKEQEIVWQNKLKPQYNIIRETEIRREISEETRKKMSIARKGIPSKLKGTKNPNYKRTKKKKIVFNNKEYTIQELADEFNCSVQNIYQRIKRNKMNF